MIKLPKPLEVWNRKLHIYLGLFFLIFIWLFSVSGMILNHPQWRSTQFWQTRQEIESEHTVAFPAPAGQEMEEKAWQLAQAQALMDQLGLRGEIHRIRSAEGQFEFRVARPGRPVTVSADEATGIARVTRIRTNAWGIIHNLHQFNGVSIDDPEQRRDWLGTTLWTFSMDALSAGLIFMVFSGLYMWYRLGGKRIGGVIALIAGIFSCGFFIWGLGWWAGP